MGGANCVAQKEEAPLEEGGGGNCSSNPTCTNVTDFQTGCKKCSDPASGKPGWSCDECCPGCRWTPVGGRKDEGYCACGTMRRNDTVAYEQQPDAPPRCPTGAVPRPGGRPVWVRGRPARELC